MHRAALLALLLALALSAGAQGLIPGVGLVARTGDRIVYSPNRGPDCPLTTHLNAARDPWAECGVPLSESWPRDASKLACWTAAYDERYGGKYRSDGLSCRRGGFAGGDPHGVLARGWLADLCKASAGGAALTGTPQTHTCVPTEKEVQDCVSAGVWSRVEAAHRAWRGTTDPTAPPPPENNVCSTIQRWKPGPISSELLSDPKCRVLPAADIERLNRLGYAVGSAECCSRDVNTVFRPRECELALTPACMPEEPPREPFCGDGILDPGEDCITCPQDQPPGACDGPEPPVESGCGAALAALSAAADGVEAATVREVGGALDALREALEAAEEVCRP